MAQGWLITLLLGAVCLALGEEVQDKGVAKARVEFLKQFYITCYHNTKFQHIGGAPPELLLLNKDDEVLERIDLKKLSQDEINQLMIKKGFYKKSSKEEDVPEEYREGPYVEKEEL
ncbi:Selenoprotein M [Portunus trituberculatus]|uniref:Selenoprotein M n=1 Tax=Portunus trituberculatus TaxID=210409 RepID=A0A5B7D347_PORTR|nr:Selenoprotein M [Portunus trituberculatus]